MKLEDVLKKLNKGKAEEDKFQMAEKVDTFDIEFSSSGFPYLDYYMGNKVVPLGAMTLLTGWEGSGKTSNALIMAREIQKKTNKVVVIFDGEQTITDSHLSRFGVDKTKLILYKDSVLENMLDNAEAFSQSEDVGGILIDSIKSFYSLAVEAKSAEDNHIGIEAKKIGSRFAIINANCARRGIGFIVLNQWRENPGTMSPDSRVLPGGNWNKFMPFTHLDFTKKDLIKDENKKVIGHSLDVRIRKSKAGAYDRKEVVTLNFYYEGGSNLIDEYAQIFIGSGIVVAGGAWITYPSVDGEEMKVNGLAKFIEVLKQDEELFEFLKSQLDE